MGVKDNFKQAFQELTNPQREEPKDTPPSTVVKPSVPVTPVIPTVPAAVSKNTPPPAPTQRKPRTIIAEGTLFVGRIEATGGVELFGQMDGDIVSQEDIRLCGELKGNVTGMEAELSGCMMKGDLIIKKNVTVGNGSVVVGNIDAENLMLNGKVKGNLTIQRNLILNENAVLAGNATTSMISLKDGAMVAGEIKTTAADWDSMFTLSEVKRPSGNQD